jgi:hypothetical protein
MQPGYRYSLAVPDFGNNSTSEVKKEKRYEQYFCEEDEVVLKNAVWVIQGALVARRSRDSAVT